MIDYNFLLFFKKIIIYLNPYNLSVSYFSTVELLTNAIRLPSGDHEGVLMVP